MKTLHHLGIRLFADGADRTTLLEFYEKPYVKGLITNPTLMRRAGVRDYEAFIRELLPHVSTKPFAMEVLSDDFVEMRRQARTMSAWAENLYVGVPITNSRGESSLALIRELGQNGVKVNVTAIHTQRQVASVVQALNPSVPSIVSVFAGRIADTGVDPVPVMRSCTTLLGANARAELLWAGTREVLNLFQAEEAGCAIVAVPFDILDKAAQMIGADLSRLSLETVRMFARDTAAAGYRL